MLFQVFVFATASQGLRLNAFRHRVSELFIDGVSVGGDVHGLHIHVARGFIYLSLSLLVVLQFSLTPPARAQSIPYARTFLRSKEVVEAALKGLPRAGSVHAVFLSVEETAARRRGGEIAGGTTGGACANRGE